MRFSGTLFSHILKTSSDEDSTMSLARLYQWMIVLTVKNFFLILKQNLSRCNLYALPLVFSMWLLVKRELSCSCSLSTGILWWGFPWAFSSARRKDLTPSACPLLQPFDDLHGLLWTLSNLPLSFLHYGDQNWTLPGVVWQVLSRVGRLCLYFC